MIETAKPKETTKNTNLVQKTGEIKLRLRNFVACKTVGEYNRNRKKIEKFCFEEKRKRKAEEMTQDARNKQSAPTAPASTTDIHGHLRAPTAHSTPVDIPGPSRPPTTYSITPSKQPAGKLPIRKPKKATTKRSTPKKPIKHSKQSTAQKKLTKAKLAALRQSQDFATKQRTKVNWSKVNSPHLKKFNVKASTPYNKGRIIVTSSSPTDFMSPPTTQSNPIMDTIPKSPTRPNPRKGSADHTVRKLHVENMLSILPLTPPNVEPESLT